MRKPLQKYYNRHVYDVILEYFTHQNEKMHVIWHTLARVICKIFQIPLNIIYFLKVDGLNFNITSINVRLKIHKDIATRELPAMFG